jgi:hypothetical protein
MLAGVKKCSSPMEKLIGKKLDDFARCLSLPGSAKEPPFGVGCCS